MFPAPVLRFCRPFGAPFEDGLAPSEPPARPAPCFQSDGSAVPLSRAVDGPRIKPVPSDVEGSRGGGCAIILHRSKAPARAPAKPMGALWRTLFMAPNSDPGVRRAWIFPAVFRLA